MDVDEEDGQADDPKPNSLWTPKFTFLDVDLDKEDNDEWLARLKLQCQRLQTKLEAGPIKTLRIMPERPAVKLPTAQELLG